MALSVSAFPASNRKQVADCIQEPSQSQNVTEKLRTRLSLRGLFRWASRSTREIDQPHTPRSTPSSSPPTSSPSTPQVFQPEVSPQSSSPGLRRTESHLPEPDTRPQLAHQDIGKAASFPIGPPHVVLNPPASIAHERLRRDSLRALSPTRALPLSVPQRPIDSGTGSVNASVVDSGHGRNIAMGSSPPHSQIHAAQQSLVQISPHSLLAEIKKDASSGPTPTMPNVTPIVGGHIRPLPPIPSPLPLMPSSRVTSRSIIPSMRTRSRSTPDASRSSLSPRHHSLSPSHTRTRPMADRSSHSPLVSRGPLLRPDILPSRALLVPVHVYSPSIPTLQSTPATAPPHSSQPYPSEPPISLLDTGSGTSVSLVPREKRVTSTMPETNATPFQTPITYPKDGGVFTLPELTTPIHKPALEPFGGNDSYPKPRTSDSFISWDAIDESGLNPPELARISSTIGDDDERYAPGMEDYSSLFSRIPSPIYYARPSSQGSLSDHQSLKRSRILRPVVIAEDDDRYANITQDDSSEYSSVPSPICYARPNSQGSLSDDLSFELPPVSSEIMIGDNDDRNAKVTEDDSSDFSSVPSPICYARPSSRGTLSDDESLFSANPSSKLRTQPSLSDTPGNVTNQTLLSIAGSGSKSNAELYSKQTAPFTGTPSQKGHHTSSRSVMVDGSRTRQLSVFTRSTQPKGNLRPSRPVTADGSGMSQLPAFTRSPSPGRHLRPSGAVTADIRKMGQLPTFTGSPSPKKQLRPRAATADSGTMNQLSLFVRSPSPKQHRRPCRAATADSDAENQLSLFTRSPSPTRFVRPKSDSATSQHRSSTRPGKRERSGFLRLGPQYSLSTSNFHGSACGIGRLRTAESYMKQLDETSPDVRNRKGSSAGETVTKGDARRGWTGIGTEQPRDVAEDVIARTIRPRGSEWEEIPSFRN